MAFPAPINAEAGMTYFFSNKNLSYKPETYVGFVRPGALPKNFESDEIFFVFVLTTEPGDPKQPGGDTPTVRIFDEKQSAELQANATKKADPEWPTEVQHPGFNGKIQVRVEINAEGRVAHANIWNSTLPKPIIRPSPRAPVGVPGHSFCRQQTADLCAADFQLHCACSQIRTRTC